MSEQELRIPLGEHHLTALAYVAATCRAALVLAHGAGAGQRHPYLVAASRRLAARGVSVWTFDFPYMERGRKVPDPPRALEAAFGAAFDVVRARAARPLFAGGKSMGGRIATQCAAAGAIEPAGLVLLGYPLHPPGQPERRRDAHLPAVRAPMLFVQGTRDAFGTAAEIAPVVESLRATSPDSRLFVVEQGDHSHVVPKRGGVAQEAVHDAIADAIATWMAAVT